MNSVRGLDELKTFGYSVSGGVDVDNNQFNGMLILVILYIHNVQKFLTMIIIIVYMDSAY